MNRGMIRAACSCSEKKGPLTTETSESVGFIKVGQDSYNAVTKITEPSGRSMTRARLVTPASATVVTTEDDSATLATTDKTTTEINGYIQTVEHAGIAVNETFAYDSFGRIKQYSDARNAATYSYYDYNFRLAKVTNQLRQDTLYQYYQSHESNAGQIKSITRADQGVEETTYTSLGQISGVSGSGAYPRTFGYDVFGDKITMSTYGTQTSVTRWTYDPATGLLASKRQNDGGSESTGWDYEYTLEGEIAKRTFTGGVVTDYDYNETTGDLTGIGYTGDSDRTPDVAFSNFDGFGRPRQVTETKNGTDPHTNTQTLSHERYSGATTVNYASTHRWLKDVKVRQYADDAAGRPAGFEVLVGSTMLSNQSYHYDDRSRLDRVISPDLQSAISYLPASDRIQGLGDPRGQCGS